MTHPFAKDRNAGRKMAAKFKKSGGSVFDEGVTNVAGGKAGVLGGRAAKANAKAEELKAEGKPSKARLDKKARGGGGFMKPPKTKGFRNPKPKSGLTHNHFNVVIAPNTGAPPDVASDGAEPMVPKGPMGPPMGGPMAGGEPGLPGGGNTKLPGMAKRGGKTRRR